ncbi:hypothetical protein [Yinghuangia seranimata]|uniref:hypothetical protein n=1 Tax=Yinghuangia seranimata TaxID=408067 RepID=UPI00248C867E|nr:hypothetical protein [Yinghuangia seranimata]MDI2131834.1 hypothetical protein [Yinghuangia seranimata]
MARRRCAFVLLVLGALGAGSIPLYAMSPPRQCTGVASSCVVAVYSPNGIMGEYELDDAAGLKQYWTVTLVVCCVSALWWYARSGHLRRALAPVAVALACGGTVMYRTATGWTNRGTGWRVHDERLLTLFNGATPFLVAALALAVLAVAERSLLLTVFTAVFWWAAWRLATHDAYYALSQLGLPVDDLTDPHGLRQCTAIAILSGMLLLGALAAWLVPSRSRGQQAEPVAG